ncbi:MAG: pentapeptide repeat-containing protein [Candidatus Eisenbacteria bacterium]|nr:pentapeptide repeat-containing protein [Candidatus Eisenbacteria bacterium]
MNRPDSRYRPTPSILFAVFLLIAFLPSGCADRRFQAWDILNSTRGMQGSVGRSEALEYLCQRGSSLRKIDLSDVWLDEIDLSGAKMEEVDLRRAHIKNVDFTGAELASVNLDDAWLWNVTFREADLMNASLRGTKIVLVDLRGADLRFADLEEATMMLVDLEGADLRKASLRHVGFCARPEQSSFLCGANFRGADLREADLCRVREWKNIVDFRGANLADARISKIEFRQWAVDTMMAVEEPFDGVWHPIRDEILSERSPDYYEEWVDRDWDEAFDVMLGNGRDPMDVRR